MTALIVAYSKNNRVIGKNGKIPWKIPGEIERFKRLTTNNIVIMGRKTFEEIKNPLPNRINIVISKTKNFSAENLFTFRTFEEAFEYSKTFSEKNIFFAGGQSIYEKAIHLCQKLFITEIFEQFDGDTYFPEIQTEKYSITSELITDKFEYLTFSQKKIK